MSFSRTGFAFVALLAMSSFACANKVDKDSDTNLEGGLGEDGFTLDTGDPAFDGLADGPKPPCTGLQCQQVDCPVGTETTVSGTVYAPNGTLPLYNVIVYVPNSTPEPFKKGVTCDKCGALASGSPIVTALTDYKGQFRLDKVPVGDNIPLVIQLGKWRRQITIPAVKACETTALTDKNMTRLPKKQSEGDMPKIAVTVGGCDKLSCMLPKVGIDASEFGVDGTTKAVHFYNPSGGFGGGGGPAGMKDARVLWDNTAKLKEYDIAIFSCECTEAPGSKGAASYKAVADYLAAGGRIFTTDFQYTWYKFSPDTALQSVAVIPGGAPQGDNPVKLDSSFPKGKALADWMKYVDPASTFGEVTCSYVFNNLQSSDKSKSQTWASSDCIAPKCTYPGAAGPGMHPRFVTVNTPVGKPVEAQCGKAVHLDAHINQSDTIDATFPAGCKSPILQGEEAFAFMFFDLSSCIQKEGEAPKPPPVR